MTWRPDEIAETAPCSPAQRQGRPDLDRQVEGRRPPGQRAVGPKRSKAQPKGLTPAQAEVAFRQLREQAQARPARPHRRTVAEVGESLIRAKRAAGRKPSTLEGYEYWLRVHLVPFFGTTDVNKIDRDDVRRFDAEMEAKGLAAEVPRARAQRPALADRLRHRRGLGDRREPGQAGGQAASSRRPTPTFTS